MYDITSDIDLLTALINLFLAYLVTFSSKKYKMLSKRHLNSVKKQAQVINSIKSVNIFYGEMRVKRSFSSRPLLTCNFRKYCK
jgi:hypothetical protein